MARYEYRRDERWSRTWEVEVPDSVPEEDAESWIQEHVDPENLCSGDNFEFVDMLDGAEVLEVEEPDSRTA